MIETLAQLQHLIGGDPIYMHESELPVLRSLAANVPEGQCIVEIGTAYGGSAALFLASSKRNVYGVDSYAPDTFGNPNKGTAVRCWANITRLALALEQPEIMTQRFVLYPLPSLDVAPRWAKGEIGLLYLDGDHAYDAVCADFEAWIPHVASGGCIALHDSRRVPDTPDGMFDRGWPGPTRLANDLQDDERVKLLVMAYSLTVWEKQ